jgi:sporulation-control protein spo0M
MQRSVPIFVEVERLPRSGVFKKLLREALSRNLKPLSLEKLRELRRRYRGRKRVYLTERDGDLQEFFDRTPLPIKYAVYLYLNDKLVEGRR